MVDTLSHVPTLLLDRRCLCLLPTLVYQLTHTPHPAGYAFIEYEDERDAQDAVRAMNGRELLRKSIVVEFAKGERRRRRRCVGTHSFVRSLSLTRSSLADTHSLTPTSTHLHPLTVDPALPARRPETVIGRRRRREGNVNDPPNGRGIDLLGETGIDLLGGTKTDLLGETGIDLLGGTKTDLLGETKTDPLGATGIDRHPVAEKIVHPRRHRQPPEYHHHRRHRQPHEYHHHRRHRQKTPSRTGRRPKERRRPTSRPRNPGGSEPPGQFATPAGRTRCFLYAYPDLNKKWDFSSLSKTVSLFLSFFLSNSSPPLPPLPSPS